MLELKMEDYGRVGGGGRGGGGVNGLIAQGVGGSCHVSGISP